MLERGESNEIAQEALDAAQRALDKSAARIERSIRRGAAAAQIREAAREVAADAARSEEDTLVVVGSQGHSGIELFFLGSVAERVARHAPCPVLVARPLHGGLHRILVAIDGSGFADAAVDYLGRLPLPEETEILLASVLVPSELFDRGRFPLAGLDQQICALSDAAREGARQRLQSAALRLSARGLNARTELREGDATTELLALARESRADLLVAGSRGSGGFERALLGSVAEKLVRHAPISVLVVRDAAG